MLSPIRDGLVARGISANQITIAACVLSLVYALLAFVVTGFTAVGSASQVAVLWAFPLLLLLRMALNALDGMLATHTQSQSRVGMLLNECCDVISDAALYSVFLVFLPNCQGLILLLILLSALTEYMSLAVHQACGIRPYHGPFGKSDRAVYFSIIAIALALLPDLANLYQLPLMLYLILGCVLAVVTVRNRANVVYQTDVI